MESKEKKENGIKKNEKNSQNIWDIIAYNNICQNEARKRIRNII